MTTSIIKLTTGEEIVCKITNETDTHTSIKNPLKIIKANKRLLQNNAVRKYVAY